ncbi:MAG: hypothetical protein HOJ88_12005 [Proteobacteria bacterium]|mgnify:FL=1|jgi:hypothetical protein|nr:hypothetical protein [Pseudomonadota bacterium]
MRVRYKNSWTSRFSSPLTWLILLGLGSSSAVLAHHGSNSNPDLYLAENLLRLEGEISTVFWRNPHPRLMLKVIDEQGAEKEWELEMGGSLNSYAAQDITKDFIKVGDKVKAAGVVSMRDPNTIGLINLLLPNGEEMVNGNRRPLLWSTERMEMSRKPFDPTAVQAAKDSADGFFRVWGRRTSPRPSPEEYAALLTEVGRARAAEYFAPTDNPELECRSGVPTNMFDPTPMEIIDDGDRILIHTEEHDLVRTVHMTEDRPEPVASNLGYSVGYYEGEKLIVDTTHIEWPYFDPYGTPQSDQMSYKETFWIAADDSQLNYSIVATDPVNLTAPIVLERAWRWQPGTAMVQFDCAAEVIVTD